MAISVVCLVLRGAAKVDISCNCVERRRLSIGVGLYLLMFYGRVFESEGLVVASSV